MRFYEVKIIGIYETNFNKVGDIVKYLWKLSKQGAELEPYISKCVIL